MRRYIVFLFFMNCITAASYSQSEKYISLAVYNTQTAMPFGKFAGLFQEVLHPGVEFGVGKIVSEKKYHEWFADLKLSYFFHRFVQHGIPLYADFGYRHKILNQLSAETFIGAGYLHSVPATEKLKLNSDGEYENNKGIGRMQATASFALGISYDIPVSNQTALKIFTSYQQRVQMPFVKSYVPFLPYNTIQFGVCKPVQKKYKNSKK